MFARKNVARHLIALILPVILIFACSYWYDSYLFNHTRAAYLAFYAKRWDHGLDVRMTWRIAYSAVIYAVVIAGTYELALLALGGRFKGED